MGSAGGRFPEVGLVLSYLSSLFKNMSDYVLIYPSSWVCSRRIGVEIEGCLRCTSVGQGVISCDERIKDAYIVQADSS